MSAKAPRHASEAETSGPERLTQPRSLLKISLLLLLWDGPGHGYDLISRLGSFGFEWDDTGAVYQALRRLEDGLLVASTWDLPTGPGPARRVYELTASGKEQLERCAPDIRIFRNVLEEFFARHPTAAS